MKLASVIKIDVSKTSLEIMLAMKRAEVEVTNANLYLTDGNYNPDRHAVHAQTAHEYLNEAEALIGGIDKEATK